MNFRGLLKMDNRFIHLPVLEQKIAEIIVGFRKFRLDGQRLLVMPHRLVYLSALEQRVAEVILGIRVIGLDFQALFRN